MKTLRKGEKFKRVKDSIVAGPTVIKQLGGKCEMLKRTDTP